MATIPNTPDIRQALVDTVTAINAAAARLAQLHNLGATDDGLVVTARAERDAALADAEALRREIDRAATDLASERQRGAKLEAKLASCDAHPDVIAARKAALEKQQTAIRAELDKLGK